MVRTHVLAVTALSVLAVSATAEAQYNASAGVSVPQEQSKGKAGEVVYKRVASDGYGNAQGNQYDLAVDGAFEGQTVTVLQFYTGGGFDFELPRKALREKGFSVYRFLNAAPTPKALSDALKKSSQLWIVAGDQQHLGPKHLKVIREFFEAGHGLYIWGDNPPYTNDANYVASALLGATMDSQGYVEGQKVVTLQRKNGQPGIRPNHLLSTGIEYIYEGHTIPELTAPQLDPLIIGSNGILVAATYDRDGKRAVVDTGFTRLYINWDSAGTGRYVKNAAAWLANAERFGAPTKPPAKPTRKARRH